VDDSTEGWETIREESPTMVIFDTVGESFTGDYLGHEVIHNPLDDEDMSRHRFRGLDGELYALWESYALQDLKPEHVGDRVRITYVKDIPSKKGNPVKDLKVQRRPASNS
jgi:hypothetical protein